MFRFFKTLSQTLFVVWCVSLILSCGSQLGAKKDPVSRKSQSTVSVPVLNQEDALILHIQKTLPGLPLGLSKDEVEEKLGLPSHFRGLILSEGTGTDFRYFYELGDYELVLAFDYQKKPNGMYLQGFLRRV